MENKDYSKFIYYQRVQDNSVPYHIKQIELSEIDTSRPTVIEFGGSGTIGAKAINGYLKTTESQLLGFSGDVNIIGVDYNSCENGFHEQSIRDASKKCESFVDEFLVPLSLDKDGNLNVQVACKNLRNLTFKTFCLGHEVIYYLDKMFKIRLLELGYSDQEAREIMAQILEISYGSEYVPLDFKQVYIASQNDGEIRDPFYTIDALLNNLKSIEISTEDKAEIEKLSAHKVDGKNISDFFKENERVYIINNGENALVFCFSYPVDTNGNDHSLYFAKLGKNLEKSERATTVGHYVTLGMSYVLCYSVQNSIQNSKTAELIPVDLENMRIETGSVVKPLNSSPLGSNNQKMQ